MEKFINFLVYFDKQESIVKKLYHEIVDIDVSVYANRYLFAGKTQQLYTALEDLFKQIAKTFENHIRDLASFHKELLVRMNTEMPKIRPAVLSKASFILLNKTLSFRHFYRHAYDCELDEQELRLLQTKLRDEFSHVEQDLRHFRQYIQKLCKQ